MKSWLVALLGLLTLGLAGCATQEACGPLNCPGCCALDGTCQEGAANQACGTLGEACVACTGITTCGPSHTCGNPLCVPRTCAQLSVACGTESDGCGGKLECGACEGGKLCAWFQGLKQCGRLCPGGCGASLSCTPEGVCAGDQLQLVLDEVLLEVPGTLRINGAAPAKSSAQCAAAANPDDLVAEITWKGAAPGVTGAHRITCRDPDFGFKLKAVPGRYAFTVRPGPAAARAGLALPDGDWTSEEVLVDARTVAQNHDAWFDVRGHALAQGRLRIDGAVPAVNAFCAAPGNAGAPIASVQFQNRGNGAVAFAWILCGSPDFGFSALLAKGRYDVRVYPALAAGPAGLTLPETGTLVREDAPLSELAVAQVYDVRTVTASGKVTVDGALPTVGSYCNPPSRANEVLAYVQLKERTRLYSVTTPITCQSPDFSFTARLPERGTWDVSVSPGLAAQAAGLNLLPMEVQVIDSLAISSSVAGLVADQRGYAVVGVLSLKGQAPAKSVTFCGLSPGADLAVLRFKDTRGRHETEVVFHCDSPSWSYAVLLPPGTWRATLERAANLSDDATNLAEGVYAFPGTFEVAGPKTVHLDADAHQTGVQVRVNGKIPELPVQCQSQPGTTFAVVELTQVSTGWTARRAIDCRTTAWKASAPLAPGAWKVRVRADDPQAPLGGLLPGWVALPEPIAVPLASGNVQLDQTPVQLAGAVYVNGRLPVREGTNLATCGFDGLAGLVHLANADRTYTDAVAVDCMKDQTTWAFNTWVQGPGVYSFAVEPTEARPQFNLAPYKLPVLWNVEIRK